MAHILFGQFKYQKLKLSYKILRFQSQKNPAITTTSSIPLVDSDYNCQAPRGVWRDQGVQLFGIILGPPRHLSGTPTRGQFPTPPRSHSPPPPGSPSPPEPHTHPPTHLPAPAPRGPSPLPAWSFATSRGAQG